MTPEEEPLRLVMFGLPSSGKSSLLGSLVQAGELHDPVLNARLVEPSPGLLDLREKLSKNHLDANVEEVTPHTLKLEPLPKGSPVVVEVVDSSGKAAAEMVSRQRPVSGRKAGALGDAIGDADALIVTADAAAEPAQLQRDFPQIAAFLQLFEKGRCKGTEVAGLPLYLVLTKCDLLAKKTDTLAAWAERIEQKRRQVEDGLRKYFAKEEKGSVFGKVDLRVRATAARRPTLADGSGSRQGPYGVAELFRQCLQSAGQFRERRRQADSRLNMALVGTLGLLAVMLLVGVGVQATRPSADVVALENALQGILPSPLAKPAERLREPLDKKLDRIQKIEKTRGFSSLPPGKQAEILSYEKEVQAYLAFNKSFLDKVPDPRLATREQDLALIEKRLDDISLPAEHAEAWKDTRVGRRPQQWRDDISVLRQEVGKTEAWIKERIDKGHQLEEEGLNLRKSPPEAKKEWLERYRRYVGEVWPHPPASLPPGAYGLAYETVYRFDRVDRARQVWDEFKQKRLGYVRQLLEEGL